MRLLEFGRGAFPAEKPFVLCEMLKTLFSVAPDQVITHACLGGDAVQAATVVRMVPKAVVRGLSRAVSTTVRMAASPLAAHMAR